MKYLFGQIEYNALKQLCCTVLLYSAADAFYHLQDVYIQNSERITVFPA
jgi:hypothetical protein